MRKKYFVLFLILCMFMLVFTVCGANASGAEVYKIDLSIHCALNNIYGTLYEEFANSVYKASDGRLVITVRPSGELPFAPSEYLRVCGEGTIDMVGAQSGYVSGDSKLAALASMPFLCATMDEFILATDTIKEELQSEFNKFNTTMIFYWLDSPQRIWGAGNPVTSWDDFKGLKVRTYTAEHQYFMNKVGAIPVSMSSDEVPSGVARGVVNSLITGAVWANDNKYDDFLDWSFPVVFTCSGIYVLINNDILSSLPNDLQAVLTEQSSIAQENFITTITAKDVSSLIELEKRGLTIIDIDGKIVTEAAEIMTSYWGDWSRKNDLVDEMEKVRDVLGR